MIPRNDKKSWPLLLDMTKDECKQTLRALELSTYSKIVSVLRAQGELTKEKRKILSDLQSVFSISVERHRAEIRRAVNDELLNTIAEMLAGPNTDIEWAVEGRRLVPLLPRAPPQVAYTALATKMAQLYCGINTQLKSPCETSMCGKLDDLGADSEMTDSEDETEGLRFITQSMVPQQYNADQGSYTTLPFSQEKLSKDKVLKEKKENAEEPTQEATPPSPPFLSSSMSSESNASTNSQGKQVVANAVEKRKRKRSITDHPIPHSPPPPPVPTSLPIFTAPSTGTSIQGIQTTANTIRQLPNIGSSMKISVTGGITKTSSSGPISTSTQQKVILVSTSAASGSVGSMYQRSISVPILKSTSLNTAGGTLPPALGVPISSQSGLFRNNVAATSTTTTMSVTSSAVNKIRPRFTSSILSQGSSSLPGLPPRPVQRPRSNSLVLHSEGDNISAKSLSGSSQGQSTSSEPGSANSSSLSYIAPNTLQLRPGPSISSKSNIQVKQQDGGKRIAHAIVSSSNTGTSSIVSTGTITSTATSGSGSVPSVVGGRIIGRASLPSSSQGLYVVSTSSGTITVVTRTVASAALSNPRVVTMNTISNSRPGIIRGPATTSVMSVGMTPKSVSTMRQTGSIRPVMSASKSNVIVVHKGTIGSGARPVGIQGLRDLSTKIIKPTSQGISSSISGGSSGILSGTLVVKPSPPSKGGIATTSSSTSISSNSSSFISTGSVSSNSVTTTFSSSSGNNLIVVDLNCESSSSSQGSVLQPPGGTPSNTVKNSHSLFSSGSKNLAEATPSLQSIQVRKEPSSSHEISTVSASSSLPSTFRVFKSSLLPSDREEMEVEAGSTVSSEKVEEDRVPISNLVSSTSDVRDSVDAPDEGYARGEGKTHHHSISSLSLEEHEEEEEEDDDEEMEEEDNEWLKLGLEDEDDPELEEEDEEEERNSDASSGTEKSAMAAEDSIENEADGGEEVIRTPRSEQVDMKESKPGTSGEASVSSSTGAGNEKEGEIQMLVEKAVEVLKGGDSDQARTLLYKAGFELIDSSSDPEQGPGTVELQDGYSISNIAGVSSSSAMLCSGTPLSASTPLRDESSLGSMSELDPTTGYFYSPSGGENSSEPTSNRADSPVTKEEDSLAVPEFEDEN